MAQTRLMAIMIFLLIVFIVFIGYLIVKCSNKEEPSSAVIIIFILIASAVVGVLGNNIDNVDIALEYPVKKYTMKRKIVTVDDNVDTIYFFKRNAKYN